MDATIDMSMTDGQFREIAALVQSRFGIQLPAEKRGLVTSRLQRLVRASGLGSFDEYWRRHMRPPSREVLSDLVDRLSTNHTYLWREPEHFEYLAREVLPRVRESERARDLRLWCAAAATGEEPYCIQMVVRETLGAEYDRWTAGLLATDISDGALSRAREGMYSQQSADNLPGPLRDRYLRRAAGDRWAVVDALKRDLLFRRLNLLNPTFPFQRRFHAVFCRNVMIYFDRPTKRALVDRIAQFLVPGGVLFVGLSESLQDLGTSLRHVRPGVYVKS